MTDTITLATKQTVQVCCNCSMVFSVPNDFDERRRKDHRAFYCPAGHAQSYQGKSDEEKLREQIAAQAEQLRHAEHQRDLERTRAATTEKKLKDVTTKAKRDAHRTANGVCTCCNRTFKQLAAHMKRMHPEVV